MTVRERKAYQVVECATVCGMQAHEIARGIVLGCIAGGKARMHVVTGDDDTRVGALVGEGHMAVVLDALLHTLVAGGLWRDDIEHAHFATAVKVFVGLRGGLERRLTLGCCPEI